MKLALSLFIAGLFLQSFAHAQADEGVGTFSTQTFEQTTLKAMHIYAQERSASNSNSVKNRQQAAQLVKSKYRAKVLSVESANLNGMKGYKAKLLDDKGVVFYVFVDAGSGRMRRL